MLLHRPFPMLSSRELRLHAAKIDRQAARASSSVCAAPNDQERKNASFPTSQVNNYQVHIAGGVHIHVGGREQSTVEWDAVAMSPEAKALLQKHAVKASTALKMHNVLGFEDVGDLQHLSSDLIAQLKLKPLQLEPLVHMLRDLQKQQDHPLLVGMQRQQQQQQQQGGSVQEDFCQAQHQQQHTGQTQAAGHTDATASPGTFPTADASPLPAATQAADDFSMSAEGTGQAVPASAGAAAEGGLPPAAPVARAGAPAEPGTDGHTQAVGGLNKHACIAVMKVEAGDEGMVNSIAITPDGRRAVAAGPGSELHVWDLETRSCIATLKGHTNEVAAVAITPDGRRAVSSGWDDTLRVWDLDTYACTASRVSVGGWICSVAITPDGRHVLYGNMSKLCKWAMDDSAAAAWEVDAWASISDVAATPDGRLAVTGGHRSYKHDLRVWDLEANKQVGTLEGPTGGITSVAITPDGRHAVSASCGEEDALRVWDLATRTCIGTMKGHEGVVTCVAITPDGRRVVSGSRDSKLRVWDLATFACTGIMEGHGREVWCVAITPDGCYALSTGLDGDLRMWDLGPSAAHSRVPGSSPP